MTELSQIEKDGVVYDLKDSYARREVDKRIPQPVTAEVEQFLRVLEVDDNGKPTRWETVSLAPSTVEWKFAGRFTVDENVNPFVITEDADGNPLRFKELFIDLWIGFFVNSATESVNRWMDLCDESGKWFLALWGFPPCVNVITGDSEPEEAYDPGNKHGGLHFYKVGGRLYAQGGVSDSINFPDEQLHSTYMSKGLATESEYFTGIKFIHAYKENLIRKGSFVDIYYK